MGLLSPKEAATMARGVYRLLDDSVTGVRERGQTLGCEGMFRVDDSSRFEGKSGVALWKRLSGFGYIAAGEGARQGEVLLVTRGTAISVDWLTNLNIAFTIGPSGHPVHAGFHSTWTSYSNEIRAFLRGRNPSQIHCVGHSLGGALANLNADFLSNAGAGAVSLYTFGAPRTGFLTFSQALSRRLPDNIFRVNNLADPVPMIPLFPFAHAPFMDNGITISTQGGGPISIAAHNMLGSYLPGVGESSWSTLQNAAAPATWDKNIIAWLEASEAGDYGFVMGSAKGLVLIGKALHWVLKRIKDVLLGAIGTTLAVGATCLDQIAFVLSRGAELSIEVAGHVKTIIGAIFKFLGKVMNAAVSLTTAFLRWVLNLLHTTLSVTASRTLALVGAD